MAGKQKECECECECERRDKDRGKDRDGDLLAGRNYICTFMRTPLDVAVVLRGCNIGRPLGHTPLFRGGDKTQTAAAAAAWFE